MAHRTLSYEFIASTLRKAIKSQSICDGTVLLESPIAAVFDSSRAPVRQALAALEAEGLARRFDGRGLLSGKTGSPLRVKITAEALGLEGEVPTATKTHAWQQFYYDFEQTVILRAVFGAARINELALARHYDVGRTVAGDLLNHAAKTGIVTRDDKSRWWINSLDEARFHNLYEVRILLEPAAMATAMDHIPRETLDAMRQRLADASQKFPNIDSPALDTLEEDLHVGLLEFGTNPEILEALKRTRCVLVAGKHIQGAVRHSSQIDAFMHEHSEILDAIANGDRRAAKLSLVQHLELSSRKAKERLDAYIGHRHLEDISYVID